MKIKTVRMTQSQIKKLNKLARESSVTPSELLRNKLDEFIANGGKVKTEKKTMKTFMFTDEQIAFLKSTKKIGVVIEKILGE